jgi:polyisoprenyl-phosphate glycosyltransferase
VHRPGGYIASAMRPTLSATHPTLSVVVPVYNEQDILPDLLERLRAALSGISNEIVLVDDGSSDGSVEIIEGWTRSEEGVALVQLSRNFGMEVAMSAGIDQSRGDWVVLIHADLQDPPELVPAMLEEARRQEADVVFARRIGRDESAVKRSLATTFYRMMERLARVPYQGQAGDFRLMSRRVVEAVQRMPERRRFLRGMVAWVGFKQVPIDYRRAGRSHGRGASYPQLFRLAIEALTAYSDVPLSLATIAGSITAALSALSGLVVAILTLAGVVDPSTQSFVLLALLFLGGVQLITVGIIGRYLARVHEESLRRPLYLLERVVPARVPGDPAREPAPHGQARPGSTEGRAESRP